MTPNIFIKGRCGIYGIRNILNNKVYIGRTKCFYRRCHQHIEAFEKSNSKKINPHLFNSMTKYGIKNFEMFVLEFCDLNRTPEQEVYWIDFFKSTDRKLGYNLREDSDGGMITSEETSIKISNNLKTQWASGLRSDHSEKMKNSWEGNTFRKLQQSDLLRKIKTKYVYDITLPNGETEKDCRYSRVKDLNLVSILSAFYRQDKNTVTVKNHTITRRHQNAVV